jgi:hypothetical protein
MPEMFTAARIRVVRGQPNSKEGSVPEVVLNWILRAKKFTNKSLSMGGYLPHVVDPHGSCRNNLLFAVVHKLLPWLFTAIRMYSQF